MEWIQQGGIAVVAIGASIIAGILWRDLKEERKGRAEDSKAHAVELKTQNEAHAAELKDSQKEVATIVRDYHSVVGKSTEVMAILERKLNRTTRRS